MKISSLKDARIQKRKKNYILSYIHVNLRTGIPQTICCKRCVFS